jgi:transposase InsO family protein
MTSKRVSAPFDLMAELQSDDPPLKKQGTVVAQPTQTAPKKPTLTHTQTLVKPNSAAKKSAPPQKSISQPKPSAQKTISPPNSTPAKSVPPRKPFTNGLFRPLSDKQVDMLEREYYTNKNMVGRDKLYFILKRKHGAQAPTQKAINDWLINQKPHQLHRRQFKSQTITPIKNVRVPNQMWQADLVDMGSKPDNGYKWILTVVDIFSKYGWARAMKNKERRTVAVAMADILRSQKPRILGTDNGSEFIASDFQALLRRYDIKHITGLAGRAFSQGNIERWNGTIKSVIGRLWTARKEKKWVSDLPQIVENYNKNIHASTGIPPADIRRDDKPQMAELNKANDKRINLANTEHADPRMKAGDEVRLKVLKGAIDSSTLKPNWSRGVYEVAKVKGQDGSKAPSFRVRDSDGDLLKDTYTATDLLKIQQQRLMKSPIKIQKAAPVRARTRQQARVRLTQPRRSSRLAAAAT